MQKEKEEANSLARFRTRSYSYGHVSGSNSAVECQLPKLDVAGSIPVSRSIESTVHSGDIGNTFGANGFSPNGIFQ